MDTLGIDIGTISVKYVRYKKKGRGAIISQGEYPFREAWDDLDGILADIKAKEGANLEVAIGVTSQEILKKAFTIPLLPKEEVRDVLEWSASRIISIPLDDMRYDFVLLGEVDERGVRKEEVLFVGAHREYINRIIAMFEDAGFQKVVLFTDAGFTYLPVVPEAIEGSVAIVDIGGRQTGIYIFDGKKLHLVREIMTASESFTDAFMAGIGLSPDEAELQKIERGFDDSTVDALNQTLERLGGEIRRTFSVYAQKNPARPVVRVYVTGRGARMPNLLNRLRVLLVEDVARLPAPADVQEEFLSAYMLSMQRDIIVNLLPEEIKAREREALYKTWSRIGAIGFMGLLGILSLYTLSRLIEVNANLHSERQNISAKKEQLERLKSMRSSFIYNELGPIVTEIEKKDPSFVFLLKYLSSHLPAEVYVRDVEFGSEPVPEPAAPKNPQKDAPREQKDAQKKSESMVKLRGLIFGGVDSVEASLLRLMIDLEKSGLVGSVTIVSREMKEMQGRTVMEFVLRGKSAGYEI